MNAIVIDDITVDQCHRCGGLWLDAMGKEQLLTDRRTVKSIDTDPAAMGRRQDDLPAIKCPLDHSTMIRMSDSGQKHVPYGSCTICGSVFFDAGELTELSKVSLGRRLRSLLG